MRRKRLDVRPGEVDIEEKEEDSKTGYGWLLRGETEGRRSVRVRRERGKKGGECIHQARRRRGQAG